MKETCYECNGTGYVICDRCGGAGLLPGFATIIGMTTSCDVCFGSGEVECIECDGTGEVDEDDEDDEEEWL